MVARLVDDPTRVIGVAVDSTRQAGEHLKIRVGPSSWPAALAKTVEVCLGPVRRHEDTTLVAFMRRAVGGASLLPRLEADLEVAPFGSDRTNLALRETYDPPAGLVGRRIDELLLHRLAESTVRAFLDSVGASLEPDDQDIDCPVGSGEFGKEDLHE